MANAKMPPCVTRDELFALAPAPVPVELELTPRVFSTGSYGLAYAGPLMVKVNGKALEMQASVNLIVKRSKPAA